ncbi:MAG: HNH endonuclease [Saprospiraceae bacterium]
MTKKDKIFIRQRASACCEYCLSQDQYSPSSFSIEHLIPLIKAGTSNLDNLAYSCQGCNSFKGVATDAKDPSTGLIAPLYNPRIDSWGAHFQWTEDFSSIAGVSPTGRATVQRLRLNRASVVRLRQILVVLALHPPF